MTSLFSGYIVKGTPIKVYLFSSIIDGDKCPENYIVHNEEESIEEEVHSVKNKYSYKLACENPVKFTVNGSKELANGDSVRGKICDRSNTEIFKGRLFYRNKLEMQWARHILDIFRKKSLEKDDFLRIQSYSVLFEFNYDTSVIALEDDSRREFLKKISVDNKLLGVVPHGYGTVNGNPGFFLNGIQYKDIMPGLEFDVTIDKLKYRIGSEITIVRGRDVIAEKCLLRNGRFRGTLHLTNDWEFDSIQNKVKDNKNYISVYKGNVKYSGYYEIDEDVKFYGYGVLKMDNVTYEGCFLDNVSMVTCIKTEDGKQTLCRINKKDSIIDESTYCYKRAYVLDSKTKMKWLLICLDSKEDFIVESGKVVFCYGFDERKVNTEIVVNEDINWTYVSNKKDIGLLGINLSESGENKEMSEETYCALFHNLEFMLNKHWAIDDKTFEMINDEEQNEQLSQELDGDIDFLTTIKPANCRITVEGLCPELKLSNSE